MNAEADRATDRTIVALAQINCTVGDLAGNAAKILEAAKLARTQGADVLLTPELSLCGYPPEDLLLRDSFLAAARTRLETLAAAIGEAAPGLIAIVGFPEKAGSYTYNAAALIEAGKVAGIYRKRNLPNYTVFDEERYFQPGDAPLVFECRGLKLGILICEDIWGNLGPLTTRPEPSLDQLKGMLASRPDAWDAKAAMAARQAGAQALLVLNASPYHMRKSATRYDVVKERIKETGLPVVYCNLVGAQDELVFDGASFALNAQGELALQMPMFEECHDAVTLTAEGSGPARLQGFRISGDLNIEAEVYGALKLGVKDYIGKNGFPGAIIGLSGGIDSALTLAIAADALGADKVRAVMMPSQYTADISWIDSREMIKLLGVRYDEIAIKPMFDTYLAALATEFKDRKVDATEENIQARIRGTLLMALSNKFGSIVLTTGNKSEMAVGYCTLYGDMAGGFAVIKDIAKTLVYRLARYRNTISAVIPERIITRPPSAELRPDQKDQDSLPEYDVLDAILGMYVEEDKSPPEIVAAGYPAEAVDQVVRLIRINEYKRRQAPVGVRVTHRAFGRDWRMPITNRFRE
ncbi:MAG TPA: NAD+ synthase [Burkholderiales bacterium]|jgi:NAD+ synthase (glutamine-hydrolysing)